MRILVTGGTRGIGKAVADRMKTVGHDVVTASRGRDGDKPDLIGSVRWSGDRIVQLAFDGLGGLDAVIHCAGLYDGFMDDVVLTNVLGSWLVASAAAKCMQTGGSIVLLSGGGVGGPHPGKDCPALYAATKAAIVQMAECLANEWPAVRINAVAPGPIDTGLTDHGGDTPDKTVTFVEWLLEQTHISGRLLSVKWDTPEMWASPSPELGKLRRRVR